MRMRGFGIAFALLLAGCSAPQTEADNAPPTPPTGIEAFTPETPTPSTSIDAPDHPVGRAWTFQGIQEYNPDAEITVVVADVRPDGYLFAGAAEDDVHYDALWGNPLFGVHDRALNRVDFGREWLSFPLYDGKSWPYSDTMTLTARRAPVQTPLGTEDGFRIEGSNDLVTRRWDYSPELGQMVRYLGVAADGSVRDDYSLVRVQDGQRWTWYERGELFVVPNPHQPAAFDVPEGFDQVILSAGGTAGGRVTVAGPDGAPWKTDFTGEEEWRHGAMPATPGPWLASVAGRPFVDDAPEVDWPTGWAHVNVAPVRWIRGAP